MFFFFFSCFCFFLAFFSFSLTSPVFGVFCFCVFVFCVFVFFLFYTNYFSDLPGQAAAHEGDLPPHQRAPLPVAADEVRHRGGHDP